MVFKLCCINVLKARMMLGRRMFLKENIAFKFSGAGTPLWEFYILWECKQGLPAGGS